MKKFAVVDIETTGVVHSGHGITEVAVVHLDGAGIRPAFHSAVNPEREIPRAVSQLTGIDRSLTDGAPRFGEIAAPLAQALEGRIFAAHQVNFDYTFLKKAFETCGLRMPQRRLCTVRLSRRALTGQGSARLSALCKRLGVHNNAPHRALGDALATAEILKILAEIDGGRHIDDELKRANRPAVIPAQLDAESVHNLPEAPGVYYFYGSETEKPLYIGKAVNLKRRVISHFTSVGSSTRKQMFQREVARIDHVRTDSEYMALLREDADIRRFFPKYNKAQKARVLPIAVRLYNTRGGQEKAGIVPTRGHPDDLAVFGSAHEARQWILMQMREYRFDPASAGLAPLYAENLGDTSTDEKREGFYRFIETCRISRRGHFVLLDAGSEGRAGFVLVKNGRYKGFGSRQNGTELSPVTAEQQITAAPESTVVRAVLRRMTEDKNIQKIDF